MVPTSRSWLYGLAGLLLLLLLAWSPFPEKLLGGWLLIGNEDRSGHGRAHERLSLVTEGRERAGEVSRELELRRLASAGARSLHLLVRALNVYPELELTRDGFLELYVSLGPGQQDLLLPPLQLDSLKRGGWRHCRMSRQGSALRVELLDQSGSRIGSRETDLFGLLLQPYGMRVLSRLDSNMRIADTRWIAAPDTLDSSLLDAGEHKLLARIGLHPDIQVREVLRGTAGGLFLRIREEPGRDLLAEVPRAVPDSSGVNTRDERRRRWFGF